MEDQNFRDAVSKTISDVSYFLDELDDDLTEKMGGDADKALEATIQGLAILLKVTLLRAYPVTSEAKTQEVINMLEKKNELVAAVAQGRIPLPTAETLQ